MFDNSNENGRSSINENEQIGDSIYSEFTNNRNSSSENINLITDDDIMIKEDQSSEEGRISFFGIFSDSKFCSIINLIASATGAGCLNFPTILSHIGLPLTVTIYLFVSICIYYIVDLLRNFIVDTKFFSFAGMTYHTLGKNWLLIYTICSFIFYLSVEINYLSLIYTITSKSIDFSNNNEILLNIMYFFFTITIEIFICSFISKIKRIHLFSLLSCLLFIIIVFILIIQGIINIVKGPGNKLDYNILINPKINNKWEYFFEIMSFIIEFLYGYCYNSSYPTLLSNLKPLDHRTTKIVHKASFIFIFSSYLLITFFGFFLKVSMSDILFLEDDNPSKGVLTTIFRIILCLFLFSVIPIRFIVIRDDVNSLFTNFKFKENIILVCVCIIFCNLIAYLTSESIIKFNMVTNFTQLFGGIFGVIISFILPTINYAAANGKRKIKSIIGYLLSLIFLIIGLLSVGNSIYGLFIKNDYDNNK